MEDDLLEQLLECQEQNARLRRENEALQKSLESKDALLQSLQNSLLSESHTRHASRKKRAPDIATPSTFRASSVSFSEGDKALTRAVAIKGGPLYLQTSPVEVPYGVSRWGDGRRSVALAFPSDARLLVELQRLQAAVASAFQSDGREFVPFLRPHGGSSALRVNVSEAAKTFGADRETTAMEACLAAGAWVVAIVSCQGVWFTDAKFGVTWSLVQARKTAVFSEYAFVE
jgi:hypothetical protein